MQWRGCEEVEEGVVNNCPHCRSGHDPVLKYCTWSCGVNFNDAHWRTKECYKRELELANQRIKRLEEAGDKLSAAFEKEWLADGDIEAIRDDWDKSKEAKP